MALKNLQPCKGQVLPVVLCRGVPVLLTSPVYFVVLYEMGDADQDPQSLLEEQEATGMSNSAVQRKKKMRQHLYINICANASGIW